VLPVAAAAAAAAMSATLYTGMVTLHLPVIIIYAVEDVFVSRYTRQGLRVCI